MGAISDGLVAAVVWTSLYVSVSAVVAGVLLHILRITSPHVHRLAWTCVILQAWLVYPCTIPIQVESASVGDQTKSAAESALVEMRHTERVAPALSADVLDEIMGSAERPMPNAVHAVDASQAPRSWRDLFAAMWLAGMALPAVWYVVRYTRFVRAVPLGTAPDRRAWQQEWADACREQALQRRAELRMTDSWGPLLCYVPFLYRVLVPRPLWVELDCGDRLAILRHELAHLARGDLWKSATIRVLALPQWFNPLIWWAVRRFDEAGEWACDDLAKGRGAEQHVGYAKALVRLGELATHTPASFAGARGGCLTTRVHRIVYTCSKEDSVMKKGFVYLMLLALTAAHGLRVEVVAEEREVEASARKAAPKLLRADAAERMHAEPADGTTLYFIAYDVKDLIRENEVRADTEWLIKEIQADVAPESWGEEKGRVAASQPNLSLVIRQTEAVHEEVADWLQAKRRTRELQVSSLAPYVIEPPDVLFVHAHNVVAKPPYELDVFDVLLIHASGALEEHPIAEAYSVQADGSIDLGPPYGRVKVIGLTPRQADIAIDEHLRKHVEAPEVSVSVASSAAAGQIRGKHLVGPDGTINLGRYGRVYVAGMTIPQAEAAVMLHLEESLQDPVISVDVLASNSKVYYVIRELADGGDNFHRLLLTGNETVLDAIAAAGGIERGSQNEIYVSRPAANGVGLTQFLPVDWDAITRQGDTRTNHQLRPGDRVFIRDKSINRELVDLARLEEEIAEQREVLEELESKRHERIANLEPAAIEQIIREVENAADGPRNVSKQPRESSTSGQGASATTSVKLFIPVVSDADVEEPTWEAVSEALLAARPDLQGKNLEHEKISSYVDDPREFPVVGRAQLQYVQFRVRVSPDNETSSDGSVLLVEYRRLAVIPELARR